MKNKKEEVKENEHLSIRVFTHTHTHTPHDTGHVSTCCDLLTD
jgi:hypothetical protein